MPARIVPCDSCGSPISDADLESGQAVTLLGKRYCLGCKAEAIQNVSLDELSEDRPAPVRKPAPAPKPAISKPPPAPPPVSTRGERKAPPRKPVPVAAAPSRFPLVVAAGVAVVVCAVGAFLAFRESPPIPSTPPKQPSTSASTSAPTAGAEAKAREAFLLVQELAGRPESSSEVILAAGEKARSVCKGSAFEKPLDVIIAKAQRNKEAEQSARELSPLVDELKGAVATDPEFKRYSELQPKFLLAIETAAKSGSPRVSEIRVLQSEYNARYEKLAEPYYNEIHEAAVALADEHRYDDAIRKIETFPQKLRNSGSWETLQKLRQDIERRKKK